MNRTHVVAPPLHDYKARHVLMTVAEGIATITASFAPHPQF